MRGKNLNIVVITVAILLVALVGISVAAVRIPSYNPPGVNIPNSKYPSPSGPGMNLEFIFYGFIYAWIIIAIIGIILYPKSALKEIVEGLGVSFIAFLFFFGLLLLGNKLRWSNSGSPETYSTSYWNIIYFYAALTVFIFLIVYAIIKSVKFEEREKEIKKEVPKEYVERAIYHLKLGEDVRSAILRAYREMEKIVRGKGVEDKKYYTPREFRDAILSELQISEEPVDNLTSLFEKARYSTVNMTEGDRNEALKYLEMIRDEIAT